MSTQRTVAVTGATGFVGRHLTARLLDRGFQIRALVRDRSRANTILGIHDRLELVAGDVLDEQDCQMVASGSDACIHLVGILREKASATFERMHPGATRHMVRACEQAGVRRYIQMSALGASPISRAAYQVTKFEAERVVRNSSLDWTIIRPGLIHGPDGEFTKMMAAWARGSKPPHFFMPYFTRTERDQAGKHTIVPKVQPVFVEDVADAFCEALMRDESIGEIVPIAGSEVLDFASMLCAVRDAIPSGGPQLAPVGIPGQIAAMKAHVAGLLGVGGLLPFDESMAIMAQQDATADLTKAEVQLGFDPSPFRESLGVYAAAL